MAKSMDPNLTIWHQIQAGTSSFVVVSQAHSFECRHAVFGRELRRSKTEKMVPMGKLSNRTPDLAKRAKHAPVPKNRDFGTFADL